jgi:hypothetical protein
MCKSEKKHVSHMTSVGFRWPNSTRAVVFGQRWAFHWENFCNMPLLPGRRLGSLNPKVTPVVQLLFALEGSM